MDWQHIKDDWSSFREAVRERWPRLPEESLDRIDGNRTLLMEAVQEEYGVSLEEAGVQVDRWADSVSESGGG